MAKKTAGKKVNLYPKISRRPLSEGSNGRKVRKPSDTKALPVQNDPRVAAWIEPNTWRLAGLYACIAHDGGTAILRSISIEYGPGNAECVWQDMNGKKILMQHVARAFGPIQEDV